jgi:hypothetical protein
LDYGRCGKFVWHGCGGHSPGYGYGEEDKARYRDALLDYTRQENVHVRRMAFYVLPKGWNDDPETAATLYDHAVSDVDFVTRAMSLEALAEYFHDSQRDLSKVLLLLLCRKS